jgi:hypothetical protein
MRKTTTIESKGKKSRLKTKLGIPDLEHSKAAVLRSLGSLDSVRGYQHAIDELVVTANSHQTKIATLNRHGYFRLTLLFFGARRGT